MKIVDDNYHDPLLRSGPCVGGACDGQTETANTTTAVFSKVDRGRIPLASLMSRRGDVTFDNSYVVVSDNYVWETIERSGRVCTGYWRHADMNEGCSLQVLTMGYRRSR